MSGASFQEFFLLIMLGLMVLGPKRLPQVANQLGSWLGQARRMTRMMKRQLEDEINVDLDDLNVNKNFDVTKQLGLDGSSSKKTASVSSPTYVHDPKPAATDAATEAGGDDSTDDAPTDLPDDYSPAHAADEPGTGVNDDPPELQETLAGSTFEEDSAEDDAPEKKEAG